MPAANTYIPRNGAVSSNVRLLEWALVLIVVLVILGVFAQKVRVMQGQIEESQIRSVLGELRTSFVMDFVSRQRGEASYKQAPVEANPFKLLDYAPPSYRGEVSASNALREPPGSWMFDSECSCVGYLPQNPELLRSDSGSVVMWYRVSADRGPLRLSSTETYRWQDNELK